MLAKHPDERPDAEAVTRALAAARTPAGLRSPSEMRRRRLRKRLTYAAVVVVTTVLTVTGVGVLVVRAITGVSRAMSEGDPPTLDAIGAAIPDSIVAAMRADGSLRADEEPTYAFIPARRGRDALMLLTDSLLIHRSPAGARRLPIGDAHLDLNYNKGLRGSSAVGVLVVRRTDAAPDTIYSGLTGLEFTRLRTSLTALSRVRPPATPR